MPPMRRLAAIMFTDIVGYTAMMQRDEADALMRVRRYRELLAQHSERHHGELLHHYGDGSLTIFSSAVEAVICARDLQLDLQKSPATPLRVGIHIGDIVRDGDDLYGDGVNIASRVQNLAPVGAVLFTERVLEDIRSHPELPYKSLGKYSLKNIAQPVQVYALSGPGFSDLKSSDLQSPKGKALSGAPQSAAWRIGMGALALGLMALVLSVVFLWNQFKPKELPLAAVAAEVPSVAILPFKDLSPGGDQAWFGEGIAEEILFALSRVEGLKVAGRSSSFAFSKEETDPREIGRRLNVGAVLEGSIRKVGNRIRITAQLVNTRDGFQIWSESHEEELSDIFAVQENIARSVAGKLTGALLGDKSSPLVQRGTANTEAYQAYLQGRYQLSQRVDGAEQAVAYFQKAIELDPDFATAHAGLGNAYIWLGYSNSVPSHEAFPQARTHARRALELDPRSAYAWSILGSVHLWYDWDWAAAKSALDTAIAINPSEARALLDLGWYHALRRDFDSATEYMLKAVAIDSVDLEYNIDLADMYRMWGQYDRSAAISEKMRTLYPENSDTYWMLGMNEYSRGKYREARAYFEKTVDYSGKEAWAMLHWAMGLAKSGQPEQARRVLRDALAAEPLAENAPVELAMTWLSLGEKDKALDLLEAAARSHANWLISISMDPVWDELRKEPRFKKLMQQMDFPK
jgi:adenylate cyclase